MKKKYRSHNKDGWTKGKCRKSRLGWAWRHHGQCTHEPCWPLQDRHQFDIDWDEIAMEHGFDDPVEMAKQWYLVERLSIREVQEKYLGIYPCGGSFLRFMKIHNIPIRGKGGPNNKGKYDPDSYLHRILEMDTSGMTTAEIALKVGCSPQLACNYLNANNKPFVRRKSDGTIWYDGVKRGYKRKNNEIR